MNHYRPFAFSFYFLIETTRWLRLSKPNWWILYLQFSMVEALEVQPSVGKDTVAEPVEATLLSSTNKSAVAEALEVQASVEKDAVAEPVEATLKIRR